MDYKVSEHKQETASGKVHQLIGLSGFTVDQTNSADICDDCAREFLKWKTAHAAAATLYKASIQQASDDLEAALVAFGEKWNNVTEIQTATPAEIDITFFGTNGKPAFRLSNRTAESKEPNKLSLFGLQ